MTFAVFFFFTLMNRPSKRRKLAGGVHFQTKTGRNELKQQRINRRELQAAMGGKPSYVEAPEAPQEEAGEAPQQPEEAPEYSMEDLKTMINNKKLALAKEQTPGTQAALEPAQKPSMIDHNVPPDKPQVTNGPVDLPQTTVEQLPTDPYANVDPTEGIDITEGRPEDKITADDDDGDGLPTETSTDDVAKPQYGNIITQEQAYLRDRSQRELLISPEDYDTLSEYLEGDDEGRFISSLLQFRAFNLRWNRSPKRYENFMLDLEDNLHKGNKQWLEQKISEVLLDPYLPTTRKEKVPYRQWSTTSEGTRLWTK